MRVAGQILQNLLRPAEGRFGMDHPFDAFRLAAQRLERGRFRQTGHLSVEAQLAFLKRFPQVTEKHVSESAA